MHTIAFVPDRAAMESSAPHAQPVHALVRPVRSAWRCRSLASRRLFGALLGLLCLGPALQPAGASALFEANDLEEQNFVLVAAPIGDGQRAQLNIYEQIKATRPCYAVNGAQPGLVEPLLSTFDFTGICGRFIDANGYSLRVGGMDLGAMYRLSVIRSNSDNLLLAVPTKAGAGPEMVVARTQGPGTGFLQLVFEPGWQLKRRAYGGRRLGHVYIYRDSWPDQLAGPVDPAVPAAEAEVQPGASGG
ncbi:MULTISPECIES: DUF3747 domain-containing protein [Aphanothece]|uniref:DUF3747 domain-containing protein n=1 Tax=Aphanothece TaxID=1121 RepID=UPI00398ECE00